jgi:hypothetical protein
MQTKTAYIALIIITCCNSLEMPRNYLELSIPPTPEQLDATQGLISAYEDNARALGRIGCELEAARQKCMDRGFTRGASQLESLARLAVTA